MVPTKFHTYTQCNCALSTHVYKQVLRITDILLWCPLAFHEVTCYAVNVHVYIGLVCTSAWQDMYVQLSLNVGERKVIPTQTNKTINTRNMEKGPLECPQL